MNVVISIILAWLLGVLMVIAFFMGASDEYDDYDGGDE